MTYSINEIPKAHAAIVTLGGRALAGAQTYGESVRLQHNTHVEVATDLHALIGNPATPEIPGKQQLLNVQKASLKTAYETRNAAVKAGREYCRLAIALLKPVLGTRYNSSWEAAGFLSRSLAMPRDPMAMLVSFRQFFFANPALENTQANVTAAQAQALVVSIQSAGLVLAEVRDVCRTARKSRDAALARLRKRLSMLRSELELLLEDTDGSWEMFGFKVPAAGRMPEPVTEVVVTAGGPGVALVEWKLSSHAQNYRVSWRITGSSDGPSEVGLFTDRQASLTNLPSGEDIVVLISARNGSGETAPTEVLIKVP